MSIVGSYHATRVARPLHCTEDIRLSSAVLLKLSGALKAVEVPEVRAAARLPRVHTLQVSPSTNLSMHVACSTSLKRYHSPASGARRHACSSACSSCWHLVQPTSIRAWHAVCRCCSPAAALESGVISCSKVSHKPLQLGKQSNRTRWSAGVGRPAVRP